MTEKKRKKAVAAVCCNGGSALRDGVARDDVTGDCAQVLSQYPDGVLACTYGCVGGGSCVAVCRFDAISMGERRVAHVDRDKCGGCGLCVKACPQSIIRMVLPENSVLPQCANLDPGPQAKTQCDSGCIACRICEKSCPAGAIAVEDNCAVIDQDRCIDCGMCAIKCPRGVIVDADGIFTTTR
jgi:electron transport complex protein RnfB